MSDLTQAQLKELFNYDPLTGVFIRLVNRSNVKAGDVAGGLNHEGYWRITVDGREYMAHRLAWLYVHGSFPAEQVDHANGQRANNRLSNLRACSNAQNHQNIGSRGIGASNLVGAHWRKQRAMWLAVIVLNGRRHHLGHHPTAEAAHEAYKAAKARLHTFNPELRIT